MDQQRLVERLMGTFLVELEEHLRSLNRELLLLEKTAPGTERRELLSTLFRAAHSLKGTARAVNHDALEALCHELETALAPLRDGSEQVSAECVSALFDHVDRIEQTAQKLKLGASATAHPNWLRCGPRTVPELFQNRLPNRLRQPAWATIQPGAAEPATKTP